MEVALQGCPIPSSTALRQETGTSQFDVIAFGGISLRFGVAVFEFVKTSPPSVQIRPLSDPGQGWYQRDIPGAAQPRSPAVLDGSLATPGRKILALGNSMGGYAAILFTCLCGIQKALAISPQIFISPEPRAAQSDSRWRQQIAAIESIGHGDLVTLLEENPPEVHIYADSGDALDLIHA